MLALVYLAIMLLLGDSLCRRFYPCVSLPHRFAIAFTSGLLISSWLTYLSAFLFMRASQPLLWGNLLFFILAIPIIWSLRRVSGESKTEKSMLAQLFETDKWQLTIIGALTIFSYWLMSSSLSMEAGKINIANYYWSDFGPNSAIIQNFALGHNFPTEYPHYSGERILYHFLFYFQVGNLEYLGFNLAWSNNLLSVLSIVSMLILVMTLGDVLFHSRLIGWIGATLFFFHGSLSYIPFLQKYDSIDKAFNAIINLRDFLPSGFPYRGEMHGIWSQVVFVNQRHFPASIAILLMVLIFLLVRYRAALDKKTEISDQNFFFENQELTSSESSNLNGNSIKSWLKNSTGFIFSGVLLGLLPMWNSAVFTAAVPVLAVLFIVFPLRKQMLLMALTTGLIALPQVIYLKTGHVRPATHSLFYWGYTIDNPTFANVVEYLGFTFGFKWLLLAVALFFATWFQRRVMLAVTSLFAVAFLFRFSEETLVNHKFLNIWLIVVNLFVAAALWRLWQTRWWRTVLPTRIIVVVLAALIVFGGIIDLFPIRNGDRTTLSFEGDELVKWISEQTDPKAVFLTDRFAVHRILLAGRRVFYGWPYYAWSSGYLTKERDVIYQKMFDEQDPQKLWHLLRDNNISYVAIDDSLRQTNQIKMLNENVYERNFKKIFRDEKSFYGNLTIFKVPADLGELAEHQRTAVPEISNIELKIPAVNAFKGGEGRGRGQFDKPRGMALDAVGNIYISDTGNSRIQKFSAEGEFIQAFGKFGSGVGELREPNGIAVDSAGNIYVTDAFNHRLKKFKTDGTFEKDWNGPPPGFYGPRDVAIAPDGNIYVIDQGRARIVKLNPAGELITEWGRQGTGASEFGDATGLAVTDNRVYVTEALNARIQVFDLDGKFINQWAVIEWQQDGWKAPDIIFDSQAKRLYATSTNTNEVLVFDADGERSESLTTTAPAKLDGPTSLVLSNANGKKRLYVLNTNGARISLIELGGAPGDKNK